MGKLENISTFSESVSTIPLSTVSMAHRSLMYGFSLVWLFSNVAFLYCTFKMVQIAVMDLREIWVVMLTVLWP